MTDSQLLAILLRTGRERATAVELALELLNRSNGLGGLPQLTQRELCAIPGIGPAKAAQLMAALEIGRRSLGAALRRGIRVRSSSDVFRHYAPGFRHLKKEVFRAIYLDTKHRVIRDVMISTGSLNRNIVHPREVFSPAVREAASAVIVAHNHPSGDPEPSAEDLDLTRRLVRAGEIMGIGLLDHLIIGDGCYVSLSERGAVPHPPKTLGPSS
jgi:DNA repair protein RadC